MLTTDALIADKPDDKKEMPGGAVSSGCARAQGHPTIEAFWREAIGVTDRGHLKGTGNGYQKLRPSSRVRRNGDGLAGVDARYLQGLREYVRPVSAARPSRDVPRQQLADPDWIRVIGDAGEDVAEVSVGVEAVELGSLDEGGVCPGGACTTLVRAREEPVLTAEGHDAARARRRCCRSRCARRRGIFVAPSSGRARSGWLGP